jgi:hypothetical protein
VDALTLGPDLMKATHITLVLLLALLSYPCYSQFAPEGFDDALSKDAVTRERVAWEAARNKDKAGLAALLSEDFTEITEDGVLTKRKFWPIWIIWQSPAIRREMSA